jgi:SAM-dependent methyltransferase
MSRVPEADGSFASCEPSSLDPFVEFDWAAHWRRLVERSELRGVDRQGAAYWEGLAAAYSYWVGRTEPDRFIEALEPFLSPSKTLLDVGCGPGTHLRPLVARLARVVGVEPAAGMRARIPADAGVTVVADRWEDAEVDSADLVISSLVLNFVAEPVPFIEKMEAHAWERCVLHLLDDRGERSMDGLFTRLTGRRRPRSPRFADAYNLLRWMGIRPHVIPLGASEPPTWVSVEAAVADCRGRLAPVWNEDIARAWLNEHLKPADNGGVRLGEGRPTAIAHWAPRHRGPAAS